jgi:alkanesulfonate monooxygenase SsuD/methylene tetrahydromethanopterin reductase-like flavin-dependent oxidoreductase (luciferase family)
MKFGFFEHIDHDGLPLGQQYEERLRLIEAAEREGLYAYHLAEHHGTPLGGAPAPGLFLAAVAQRTARIKLGPLVYLLPLYHPLRLMEEICMLDHLSNGRLQLGIGRGGAPVEHALFGIDVEPAALSARYEETRDILMLALANDSLTYHGRFYDFDDVPIVMKPVQRPHPPLWYGTAHVETAPWCVANEVNVLTLGPTSRAQTVGAAVRAEWAAQGKDPAALPLLGMTRHLVVADTDAEAKAIASNAYHSFDAKLRWLWDRQGKGDQFPGHFIADFAQAEAMGVTFAGSPAAMRDYVARQIAESGISYLAVGFAYGSMTHDAARHSLELFAREVMPAFTDVERIPVPA